MRIPGTKRIIAGCLILAAALGLWSFWLEPASLRLREECIPIAAPLRQALRIAILTDLHVGSPYNGLHKLDETQDTRPRTFRCLLSFSKVG